MDRLDRKSLEVARLGQGRFASPLQHERLFVGDDERVVVSGRTCQLEPYVEAGEPLPSFELAGPRRLDYFDPARLACGIVTCGGLCPGVNNVIRAIVLTLHHSYGARRVLGFRYGYAGLAGARGAEPVELDLASVRRLHETGGTFLGTSRGPQPMAAMIDTLVRHDIGVLFAIGGDGTLRGASAIAAELRRRGRDTAVVGIPKTIDNDIRFVDRSFGFTTAVETAREAIAAAHTEAASTLNGVGLVKLMGRHAGFIAAEATLASADVNFCLVPEFPFRLHGGGGLLEAIERRLAERQHAVVVVAEGAGQDLFAGDAGVDASGNVKLHDIGARLRGEIDAHLRGCGLEYSIKYIDPSYIIRGLPANSLDATLCLMFGQHAVHAGMSGRTDLVVAYRRGEFVHVPIPLAVERRRQIDEDGLRWQRVLEVTGQGALSG